VQPDAVVWVRGTKERSVMKSWTEDEPGKERISSRALSSLKMAAWVSARRFAMVLTKVDWKGGEGQVPRLKVKVAREATANLV
jgi:hypothetical protein